MSKLLLGIFISFLLIWSVSGSFEDISKRCKEQFSFFWTALGNRREWAMEFYDTWGKIQHGVLDGNVFNFGSYDECLAFTHKTAVSTIETIRGKHCMISYVSVIDDDESLDFYIDMEGLGILAKTRDLTLSFGICVPNSCSEYDATEISELVLQKSHLNVTKVICEPKFPLRFRIKFIAITIFSALLLTVIISTIYELYMHHRDRPCKAIFITFSLYNNGKNLFTSKKNEKSKSIECLNGLRVLSILWIIFGHRFFDMFTTPAINSHSATESWLKNILSLFHTTFHLAVDTFFVMGGLLVTTTFMRSFDTREFNVLKIYFHRFLRYTPLLMFLLLFFVSFTPYLGSGPIYYDSLQHWLPNCYNYWWSTILHIATYTNITNLCIGWTWYLSADFQMFLASPALIYPAWKWRWKFFPVFPFLIVANVIHVFMVSYYHEFLVFIGPMQPLGQFDYDRHLYYATHARIGSWLVGMALGFIMYESRDKVIHINGYISRIFWAIAFSLMLLVFLGYFPFQQPDKYLVIRNFINNIYNSLYRVCWSVAIAWIIFSCHNGSGGIVNFFLSLSQFQPIARMSLSIYLTHRVYQIITISSIRQPLHLNPRDVFHVFLGDVVVSLVIGAIVYLCIEAPFGNLEKQMKNKT